MKQKPYEPKEQEKKGDLASSCTETIPAMILIEVVKLVVDINWLLHITRDLLLINQSVKITKIVYENMQLTQD